MASSINADNGVVSGSSGLKSTADTSGVLALQSNGTTGLTLNTSLAIGVGSSPSYGMSGQVLTSSGSGAAPTWVSLTSGGFTAKTGNYTAVSGDNILADTSAGSWTLTLPASPTTGSAVQVMDSIGTFGQYPLTVGRNSSTIMGAAEDMTLVVNGAATTFVYNGSTWRVI